MDIVGKIIAFEDGEMEFEDILDFFQELVSTGQINHLQGSYQSTAMKLIEDGLVMV